VASRLTIAVVASAIDPPPGLGQVGSGAQDPAGVREHHHPDGPVLSRRRQAAGEFARQRPGQGIAVLR
jgi:hypothetical protein